MNIKYNGQCGHGVPIGQECDQCETISEELNPCPECHHELVDGHCPWCLDMPADDADESDIIDEHVAREQALQADVDSLKVENKTIRKEYGIHGDVLIRTNHCYDQIKCIKQEEEITALQATIKAKTEGCEKCGERQRSQLQSAVMCDADSKQLIMGYEERIDGLEEQLAQRDEVLGWIRDGDKSDEDGNAKHVSRGALKELARMCLDGTLKFDNNQQT